MTWRIWADSYDTDAEFTNGTKSIRVKFGDGSILKYVRTWIAGQNDPGLTNITMSIYSDNNGTKDALLYNSLTTFTKAQITTKANFVKELYFEFDELPFDSSNWYHLALHGTSSGFSVSSNIAWKTSFPWPVYATGVSGQNLAVYPYNCSIIGAEF